MRKLLLFLVFSMPLSLLGQISSPNTSVTIWEDPYLKADAPGFSELQTAEKYRLKGIIKITSHILPNQ